MKYSFHNYPSILLHQPYTVIPVAKSIDFVEPEIIFNGSKVCIESPLIIDEKASEKVQQIINDMGDNYEE